MISDGSIIQGVSAYTRTDGTTGVAGDVALVYDAGIKAKPGSATADPSGSGFGLRIQGIDAPTAMATDARLNQVAQDTRRPRSSRSVPGRTGPRYRTCCTQRPGSGPRTVSW